MTRDEFEDWILVEYALIVEGAGADGIKKAEAVDEITDLIQRAVNEGSAEVPNDLRATVASIVTTADEKARHSQVTQLDIWFDCVNGQTILGRDDPVMNQVALCGSGIRKAWGYCTIEDIQAMTGVKTQHAADAATAANDFQQKAQKVISALLRLGADAVLRDLAS